jgi:hypothetical protein
MVIIHLCYLYIGNETDKPLRVSNLVSTFRKERTEGSQEQDVWKVVCCYDGESEMSM